MMTAASVQSGTPAELFDKPAHTLSAISWLAA